MSHMNMMVEYNIEDIKRRVGNFVIAEDIRKKMTHIQLTSRYTLNLFNNIPLFEEIRERKWNEMIHRGIYKINVNYTSLAPAFNSLSQYFLY